MTSRLGAFVRRLCSGIALIEGYIERVKSRLLFVPPYFMQNLFLNRSVSFPLDVVEVLGQIVLQAIIQTFAFALKLYKLF